MSYNDDEELKIGEFEEEDDELDLDDDALDPLDDDLTPMDDIDDEEDELGEGFAGLDGSSSDY